MRGWLLAALGLALGGCAATPDESRPAGAGTGVGGAGAGASASVGTSGTTGTTGSGAIGLDAGNDAGIFTCSGDLTQVLGDKGVVVRDVRAGPRLSRRRLRARLRRRRLVLPGNLGCDFVVATPSFYPGYVPPCFAVFLANGWAAPAHVTVSYDSMSLDPTLFSKVPDPVTSDATAWPWLTGAGLGPEEVAVVFLSSDPTSPFDCPVPPALSSASAVIGTGRGHAFHIQTDIPVSAYDILPYGGAPSLLPSAELLQPTTSWGSNYVAVVPPLGVPQGTTAPGPQWAQVVAAQDDTTVTIVPNVDSRARLTWRQLPPTRVATFQLSAGDHPVAADRRDVRLDPLERQAHLVQRRQRVPLPPLRDGDLGRLRLRPPQSHQSRRSARSTSRRRGGCCRPNLEPESTPYRMVGTVDGTLLAYDPPVPGAPLALQMGSVSDFEATTAFRITSQDDKHPFYFSQIMPGCGVTGNDICRGDEEHVNVLPPPQFLGRYVFFTDPTYFTTELVLTRAKAADGTFKDVTVDCLGSGRLAAD